MSPTKPASTVAGLRRGVGTTHSGAGADSGIPNQPSGTDVTVADRAKRPEKPVRLTLDLDQPTHQMLKTFAVNAGVGVSAAKVLRALLAELRDDDDLAERIRVRIWQARA